MKRAADIEKKRKILKDDLRDNTYVEDNPLGHANTLKKIQAYLFACVDEPIGKADCVDWLYNLYANQTEEEKKSFGTIIDSIANALYEYKLYQNDNR